MNEKDLMKLIMEQFTGIMSEQEVEVEAPEESDGEEEAANDSVDSMLDSLFLQYEKLSLPSEEDDLQEVLSHTSLKFILEQDADDEDDVEDEEDVKDEDEIVDDADEEAAEEDAEDEATEEPEDDGEIGTAITSDIDIGTFAAKVARLAELPEKVLDIKSIIISRAISYIENNYDESTANEFRDALMNKFQLEVPEEEIDRVIAADLPAPAAMGAGGGGAA
jgi:hypothetical protein